MAESLILFTLKGHVPLLKKRMIIRIIINRDQISIYVVFNKLEKVKLVKCYYI